MKIATAFLLAAAVLMPASGQERPQASDGLAPSIGLEIGRQAPAFALTDQFGHKQSNETLKGSKGTVILFFRSADW